MHLSDMFPKSVGNADSRLLIRRFFGETDLALANGHEWRRRRKIANPAFHRSMPIKLFSNLAIKAFEQIDKTEGPLDVNNLMTRVTLDAIGLAGFGYDLNAIGTPDGEWVDAYVDVTEHLLEFPYIFLPVLETHLLNFFPKRRAKHEKLTKLNNLFEEIIKRKRETLTMKPTDTDDGEKDLLTLLIESGRGEDEDSEPLNDSELRDELVIYFFAGHDTTSCTLSAALYYLAANPAIQKKARQEALEVLGDEARDVVPTADQLKKLPYLSQVMKETVRMASPVVDLITRKAAEDTELEGMVIPKDTAITVDIAALHYNDKVWKNPGVFDPERFADGGEYESMASKYFYLPFGGGARQCIGMNFSLTEQRVLLTAILRKYELSLPEDSIHKDGLQFNSNLLVLSSKNVTLEFKPRY
ncbi:hypothetical protein INT43_000044 [Umbelopsis isabellina]|uniref:Cytochrome P450 n=1 Tax=Mortierella isabellina TaxID=91625 RepID=A0A8H7PEY1_MORIS|nr:hypothetical protein INT43_000044 [Umbelopsis isabellina]